MLRSEIITVGTEILLGDILNTNSRYLSKKLAELGIGVFRHTTVGDNPQRLLSALKNAGNDNDIVIITGGLGPTKDDITKEVLCSYAGLELIKYDNIEIYLREYFRQRHIDMPESNLVQAYYPKECTIFPNDTGTAAGFAIEFKGTVFITLPGPPGELSIMFDRYVSEFLTTFSKSTIVSHTLNTFALGESAMAELAADYLEGENPTVAPYAETAQAYLRVTARAQTAEEAEREVLRVIDSLKKRLGIYAYGIDSPGLEYELVKLLAEKKLVIATAESCTGGLVAKRITDVPGSSAVFNCTVVSYSNEIKESVLGVKRSTLQKYGAVSVQTAREMALGALRVSGADLALSTTGIAGPGSDGTNKPTGLCFAALADKNGNVKAIEIHGKSGADSREYNRILFSSSALNLARLYLI